MCGIAGLVTRGRLDEHSVRRMVGPIAHRGPDDEGVWVDASAGIGLGNRRLAIIDLSPAGHQPMHSSSGRFVLTFNGEIYNHPELRAAVEGRGGAPQAGWRGHSDTEVLLAERGHTAEGIKDCLVEEVARHGAGRALADDLTILVLRVERTPSRTRVPA